MDSGQPNPPPGPPEVDDPRLAIPEILRERPARPQSTKSNPDRKSLGETAKAWGMALDLVFTTIGGLALGWLFDWWRGTAPWGAIIGLGIGFLTAAIRMIRSTLRTEAREKAERERQRSSNPEETSPKRQQG